MEPQLVLAADDDQHILELVRLTLDGEGYEVLTATDGAEALEIALDRKPDICVLDAMMPHLDGFEVARRLSEDEATKSIPVLLLTAKEAKEVAAEGFSVGAAEYLQKPFSPSGLRARVRAVLEARD